MDLITDADPGSSDWQIRSFFYSFLLFSQSASYRLPCRILGHLPFQRGYHT